METPGNVEVDPYADNIVPVSEGKEQYQEAVGELPQDQGLADQAGPGTPLEAEGWQDGPPPQGAAGVDAHQGQAMGNGRIAATSGPPMGSIQVIAEASAALPVPNPVPPVALPAQPLSVSGTYVTAPSLDALPGVWSQLPDPSAFYVLTSMPYPRMAHPPAPAGPMMPAPITVTARTAITTTVTSSVAVSAVQAGLIDPQFAGPRAPIPGAYAVQPGYLADHQYHLGPAFEDPSGVGMYGYPDTGYAEVGAVGGVPDGAVGYLGPSGRSMQGSRSFNPCLRTRNHHRATSLIARKRHLSSSVGGLL